MCFCPKKHGFKLAISGIRLTFVVNFGQMTDYLVHLRRKWRMWEVVAKRALEIMKWILIMKFI